MPRVSTPADIDATEQVQVVVREFPDARTGLLVEVYPEDNIDAHTSGPLRSASCIYVDDDGLEKQDAAEFIDEVNTWVDTKWPDDLYAYVTRRDDADGYRIEVGEDLGHDMARVLFVAEYTDDELDLEPIPELHDA